LIDKILGGRDVDVTDRRADLLERLDETLRKVGAQSVLMSDTVGRLVGLNSTDLECLDLLYLAGPITAGRLAEHTGLTTGAITAVIDRLERAGFVRRTRDPRDRRRVLVVASPRSLQRIEPLYRRLAARTAALNEQYNDRQLAVVVDYLSRALALVAEHVTWLQTQPVRRAAPVRQRRPVRRGARRTPQAAAGPGAGAPPTG
jgi:DNA-binding MarR family transcriptional regulator